LTTTRVVVFGAGGQAKKVVEALTLGGQHEVAGFIDDGKEPGMGWFGHAVLGSTAELPDLCARHGIEAGIVSVGDNFARGRMVAEAERTLPGFAWASAIHPSASIGGGCRIGKGAMLLTGAVVQPDAVVGDHSSLDTGASLDHDSVLGDFASLAPNVATGGGCHVGDYAALLLGASVAHARRIGAHTVVGAGSVVVHDLPDHVVAYGVPARSVRARAEGEPYL
jgi:sugar O-acyltransferase (sialic acid O-acetyltransferase NeuD family)